MVLPGPGQRKNLHVPTGPVRTQRLPVALDPRIVAFPVTGSGRDVWRQQQRPLHHIPFTPDKPPGCIECDMGREAGLIYLDLVCDGVEIMVRETNRRGRKKFRESWTELDHAEVLEFLALLIGSSIVVKKNYKDYWRDRGTLADTPAFRQIMSRNRFAQIFQSLHFVDEEQAIVDGTGDRSSPFFTAEYKIVDFMNACYGRYDQYVAPLEDQALDEQMCKFQGSSSFKKKNEKKPIKYGIPLFCQADASTGYQRRAMIAGAKEYMRSYMGEKYAVAWELMERCNLLDKGFRLFVDNWYTSKILFEDLFDRNTYACGTMAGNSKGMPPVFCNKHSEKSASMGRGEAMFLHNDVASVCNWKDNQNVILLWTLPIAADRWRLCKRFYKDRNNKKAKWHLRARFQPLAYTFYNKNMGGVDLADQLHTTQVRYYRTKKWYFAIAQFVLNAAACNTYCIRKSWRNAAGQAKYSIKMAKNEIVRDLLIAAAMIRKPAPGISPSPFKSPFKSPKTDFFTSRLDVIKGHWPEKLPIRRRCVAHKERRRTVYWCSYCKVPLCVVPCFKNFHTMEQFEFPPGKRRRKL